MYQSKILPYRTEFGKISKSKIESDILNPRDKQQNNFVEHEQV